MLILLSINLNICFIENLMFSDIKYVSYVGIYRYMQVKFLFLIILYKVMF